MGIFTAVRVSLFSTWLHMYAVLRTILSVASLIHNVDFLARRIETSDLATQYW